MNMLLREESYIPFPKICVALIVGDKYDPLFIAAKKRFERKVLNPTVVSPDSISEINNSPDDFSVLILILHILIVMFTSTARLVVFSIPSRMW